MYTPTPTEKALNDLMEACGLSGESGTEQLFYWLHDAVHDVYDVPRRSHEEEGLFIDMCMVLAHKLEEYVFDSHTVPNVSTKGN